MLLTITYPVFEVCGNLVIINILTSIFLTDLNMSWRQKTENMFYKHHSFIRRCLQVKQDSDHTNWDMNMKFGAGEYACSYIVKTYLIKNVSGGHAKDFRYIFSVISKT